MTQKLKDIIDDREPLLTDKAKEIIEDVINCVCEVTGIDKEHCKYQTTIKCSLIPEKLYINLKRFLEAYGIFDKNSEIFKMVATIYDAIAICDDRANFKYFSLICEDY